MEGEGAAIAMAIWRSWFPVVLVLFLVRSLELGPLTKLTKEGQLHQLHGLLILDPIRSGREREGRVGDRVEPMRKVDGGCRRG